MTKRDKMESLKNLLKLDNLNERSLYACKIVERRNLNSQKERLITNEIQNQDLCKSPYIVRMIKAIKTESRYYIIIEYCNGGDMKLLSLLKDYRLSA
jgi:serine/threonine protein kinase